MREKLEILCYNLLGDSSREDQGANKFPRLVYNDAILGKDIT